MLALCACWLLPGLLSRDPWRGADVVAFAIMQAMAEGRVSWLEPTLGGARVELALLPHWLGAGAIRLLVPLFEPMVAARLPFAALMAATMANVWYACLNLARMRAALPLRMAFGGEAHPRDYARALADAALLAFLATLGLLQLGHESTPAVAQLFAISLLLLGSSLAHRRPLWVPWVVAGSLLLLAVSGAPALAGCAGVSLALALIRSADAELRRMAAWAAGAAVLAAAAAWILNMGNWAIDLRQLRADPPLIARQWLWFLWPAWPLVLWTLWQWRRHLGYAHVLVPLCLTLVPCVGSVLIGGDDKMLLLGLPGLSILAAFALPTLRRGVSAAVDWFSVCFFSLVALFIWFMYVAFQTGYPPKPAANVAKLAAGFAPSFSWLELAMGAAATFAWIWLVRWRTGRHPPVLWKSMVLPAAGIVMCWMLLMSLWFPLLDYARSGRAIFDRVRELAQPTRCLNTLGLNPGLVASMEVFGKWQVIALDRAGSFPNPAAADSVSMPAPAASCDVLVVARREQAAATQAAGWTLAGTFRRPTERSEWIEVYRR